MKYRLFSLRKKIAALFFLVLSFPYSFVTGKSILGPFLSLYPHKHANKPSQVTIKKYVCGHSARLLYVPACWVCLLRVKWKCVRSNRLIYSAARRFLMFIGSTANSLGAKGYLTGALFLPLESVTSRRSPLAECWRRLWLPLVLGFRWKPWIPRWSANSFFLGSLLKTRTVLPHP